jgi:uncharacterized RDD family membrane protein YckC
MNWYYVKQGEQAGPVDDAQLEQLRAAGTIQDDTLIWREGMANWQPYSFVKSAAPGASAQPAPPMPAPAMAYAAPSGETPDAVCAECGKMFPKANMIRFRDNWVCATCKPVFMQKLSEGANLNTGALRYAGFWIRFCAKFIDGLILGVVVVIPFVIVILLVAGTASSGSSSLHLESDHSLHAATSAASILPNLMGIFFQFIFIAVNAIYAGFFVGKYGATPGKMACKLVVVDANGAPITYGRAFGRGFAEIVSRMICSIGYIIAAFDKEKRALHDHICSTRVIYK